MLKIIVAVIAVLMAIVAGYAVFAYYRYTRVAAVSRSAIEPSACISINGYDLYVRLEGTRTDATPLIVIHGGPGDSSLSFKNGFDFIAEDRRVLFFDQRGCGRSEVKGIDANLSVEALVSDIEELRKKVLNAEKVIILGHSFGGALAQRYSIVHPDRVEKLILVGSIRINNGMKSPLIWRYLGPALYSMALGLPPRESREADIWMTSSADAGVAARMADPANAVLLADTGTVSFVVWRELTASLAGSDHRLALSQFQPETLFIYGAHDEVYTGEPVARELASIMPNLSMVRFESSGHWPYLEEPERFRDVIRSFIK